MCPPSYHHNGFGETHALGHMTYGYTLLVPMNQRVLNKQSNERNISGHKQSTTFRVFKSHRTKMGVQIHGIIKTVCPPGYHHNSFITAYIYIYTYIYINLIERVFNTT